MYHVLRGLRAPDSNPKACEPFYQVRKKKTNVGTQFGQQNTNVTIQIHLAEYYKMCWPVTKMMLFSLVCKFAVLGNLSTSMADP